MLKIKVIDGKGGNGHGDTFKKMEVPDGKWLTKVKCGSGWLPQVEDNRLPSNKRPLPLWRSSWVYILGVEEREAEVLPCWDARTVAPGHYSDVSQEWWVIADKPFVVVYYHDKSLDFPRHFQAARQVHKGELGRRPEMTRKPTVVPSGFAHPKDCPAQPRPNLNWVRLEELAEIIWMNPVDVMAKLAGFSPSTYNDPCVPVVQLSDNGRERDNLANCRHCRRHRVYPGMKKTPDSFCYGESNWGGRAITLKEFRRLDSSKIWVPQSWAFDVIRLCQFGYRADDELFDPWFKLEADVPVQPPGKLPDLPVEELKTLRQYRQDELDRQSFVRIVEESLRGDLTWMDQPKMSDALNGFAHYTDFQTLKIDLGDNYWLAVSVCYWTRAGANKSPNHWAGQISVHRQRPDNPRRDGALLKLWLWPDELVRQTPSGSVGGICPDSLGLGVANSSWIKLLIRDLGYTITEAAKEAAA